MRPIRLEMEGFTSFRDRVSIDFSKLALFAITGPTGAGKTSIIDAMTYVLYGRTSRMGEKEVRELISQGMQRVKVLFEFSSNNKNYRISRIGKWNRKSLITELRLEEFVDKEWTMLADSVTKAKPVIESVIGLDFDGFTKSVILPQGRFDEFLKGKADDRRKILSDLLTLDVYNRMMKRANTITKEHQTQATFIEGQLKKDFADATPENAESLSQQLSDLEPKLSSVQAKLEKLNALLPLAHALKQDRDEVAKTEKELKTMAPQEKDAESKLLEIRKRIERLKATLSELGQKIQSNKYDPQLHLKLSSDLQKMKALVKLISDIEALKKTLEVKSSGLVRLAAEEKSSKIQLNEAKQDLQVAANELQKNREAFKQLQQLYGSPDAIKSEIGSLKELRKHQKKLSASQQDLKKSQESRKTIKAQLATLQEQLTIAEKSFANAQGELRNLERRHTAESLRPDLKKGERCPVCNQEVSFIPKSTRHAPLEKARQTCEKAQTDVRDTESQITELRVLLGTSKHQMDRHKTDVDEFAESAHALTLRYEGFSGIALNEGAETQLGKVKKEFDDCIRTNDTLTGMHQLKKDAVSQAGLAQKDKSHKKELIENEVTAIREQIVQKNQESEIVRAEIGSPVDLKMLQTEVTAQETAREDRKQLEAERDSHSINLSNAKDDLAPAQSEYDTLVASRNAKQASISQLHQRINDHTARLTASIELFKPLEPFDPLLFLEQSIRDFDSERNGIQRDIFGLQEKLQSLSEKIKRAAELREELEAQQTKYNNANELAQLLHGDNFIAFIQQEAYRRLAFDGSVHLKTLSSERYSFTVRDEDFYVIDHWNADEARPVNTLSGGESFLASLALALALAEGLSGMSSGHTKFALESLFLDEGFGTLDPETLETVVAGIEALSMDDRLIGIISHLPDLAERMLTRIVVKKSVTGSTLEVS